MSLQTITSPNGLIDWFAKKLREAEPQGIVSSGTLMLFDQFIEELKDEDLSSWTLRFENVVETLATNLSPARGNPALVQLLGDCDCKQMREAENGEYGAVSVFFGMASDYLKLGPKQLKFTDGDLMKVESTRRFEKREKVKIKVRVAHWQSPVELQWPRLD